MKIRLGLAVIVILAAVLAITNPSQEAHRKVVYGTIVAQRTQSPLISTIAVDLLGQRDLLPITYNNYYVCSTTTLNGETTSVGLFSRVWSTR